MKIGDITPVEGYDYIDDPIAIVTDVSWRPPHHLHLFDVDEVRARLTADGYHPTGEPRSDRWSSVVKADEDPYGGYEWHSEASGLRWVEVFIFDQEWPP